MQRRNTIALSPLHFPPSLMPLAPMPLTTALPDDASPPPLIELDRATVVRGEATVLHDLSLRIVAGQPIDDATVEETTQRAAIVRSTPEGHEGLSAFLEKRKPNWIV